MLIEEYRRAETQARLRLLSPEELAGLFLLSGFSSDDAWPGSQEGQMIKRLMRQAAREKERLTSLL